MEEIKDPFNILFWNEELNLWDHNEKVLQPERLNPETPKGDAIV